MPNLSSFFFRKKKTGYGEPSLFLITGLGNPGPEYVHTRHNAGFLVIDELAARTGSKLKESGYESSFAHTNLGGYKLILAKPFTYMNRSGVAVKGLMRRFSLSPDRLLVIYDDMDLPLGRIRLRPSGGSGGHKGVSSIIAHLGSEDFARLRIGIGRSETNSGRNNNRGQQVIGHVLSPFAPEEETVIAEAVSRAAGAAEVFLKEGITSAMNNYNKNFF